MTIYADTGMNWIFPPKVFPPTDISHHVSNKSILDALRVARDRIASSPSYLAQFVCTELPENDAGCYLRALIETRIYPCMTVTAWLAHEHEITYSSSEQEEYRIAWVDSMIDEFTLI